MRQSARRLLVVAGATAWIAAFSYLGCAATETSPSPGGDGAGGETTSSGSGGTAATGGMGGEIEFGGSGDGGPDPDAACARFDAVAEQAPAAMLFVLDMSASMTEGNKWGAAQLALVSAIDKDVFDTMSLGVVAFPASFSNAPMCLCEAIFCPTFCSGSPPTISQSECNQLFPALVGAPGVSCGVSALPQVAIAPAGTEKSYDPSGVRHDIYQALTNSAPLSNGDDGSPIYEALAAGYSALDIQPIDKRMLVLITDGGFSCTSLSNPQRPGYLDDASCPDWEYPDTVNQLITDHRLDASTPTNTFIVGVPGSDSTAQTQGTFATPPYDMRLALSTYAVSGSPDTIDPACDDSAVFTQNGSAPAVPCHIDLTGGAQFDADALADVIAQIRGTALGCVYPLPEPPPNETIDPDRVNVNVTIEAVTTALPKRSDPNDDCAIDGCWDYNDDGEVEILGKTCEDIGNASSASVQILVGCETIVK